VFVWVFHRISGVLLTILLPLQLVTGLSQADAGNIARSRLMADLHGAGFLNFLLAFLVIFHGVYGIRTILLDAGVGREKALFWVCTALGALLFIGFGWLWMTRGA